MSWSLESISDGHGVLSETRTLIIITLLHFTPPMKLKKKRENICYVPRSRGIYIDFILSP